MSEHLKMIHNTYLGPKNVLLYSRSILFYSWICSQYSPYYTYNRSVCPSLYTTVHNLYIMIKLNLTSPIGTLTSNIYYNRYTTRCIIYDLLPQFNALSSSPRTIYKSLTIIKTIIYVRLDSAWS